MIIAYQFGFEILMINFKYFCHYQKNSILDLSEIHNINKIKINYIAQSPSQPRGQPYASNIIR